MKIRRIPDIDLARIAVQPTANKRVALEQLKDGWPPHSLDPMRKQIGDIVNLQSGFLVAQEPTDWNIIRREIVRRCKSTDEATYNLAVAKSLHRWALEQQMVSYGKPIPTWSVGVGHAVNFWSQYYSVFSDAAYFLFVDPRVTYPLTERARSFVFSIMHQRLRVDDPDFSDAHLMILQFRKDETGKNRIVVPHLLEAAPEFGRDDLNDMIDETYRIWIEVLRGRESDVRGTGTDGSPNPMGF